MSCGCLAPVVSCVVMLAWLCSDGGNVVMVAVCDGGCVVMGSVCVGGCVAWWLGGVAAVWHGGCSVAWWLFGLAAVWHGGCAAW